MRTIFRSGSKPLATTPIILESSSTRTRSQTGITLGQEGGITLDVGLHKRPLESRLRQNTVLLDPGTYTYFNTSWQADNEPPIWRPGEYSTDIIANQSLSWLDGMAEDGRPFFMGIAPIAPHSQTYFLTPTSAWFDVPVPAKRHEGLFQDAKIPRSPSFNPEQASPSIPYLLARC